MTDSPKHQRAALVVLVYLALIGFALLAERPNDVTEFVYHLFGENCKGREETTLQAAAFPYRVISNFYSPPGELQVRLVTLEQGSEPSDIFGDERLCRQRVFVARLIQRLEQLGAKSIVVDHRRIAGSRQQNFGPDNVGAAHYRRRRPRREVA